MIPTRQAAIRRMAAAAAVLAGLPALAGCSPAGPTPTPVPSSSIPARPVVVGATDTAEGQILAELYSGALQAAGLKSSVKTGVGGRAASLEALKSGAVQLVPTYTGGLLRALGTTAKDTGDDTVRAAAVAALTKPVTALDASGAQDREVIVVTKVTAERYQLKSLSDLGKVCSQTTFAAPADFSSDPYGGVALKGDYSCTPKKTVTYGVTSGPDGGPTVPAADADNRYTIPQPLKALLQDDVQVAVMLSTDPAIADNDLVVLDDDKKALLPEQVLPLVDGILLPAQARDVINSLSRTLTSDDLVQMNRAIQGDQAGTPHDVAGAWLQDKGILK
ncbi:MULTISPECIES: ABC transporter substrate-binding protein [Arthrobacter]|uniref:ABC transporter substrate-binding protein n=2 Tax=Arthrobacter TaxID=1663 RepID=A0ABU9KMC9_9MICC|nr:ABC transporter substrate-binding protein [Arthrobacter sp. YJM1]MDP5227083.1 ABC transporter substrate-binding protein [Arthrobacter sp. YJM1]